MFHFRPFVFYSRHCVETLLRIFVTQFLISFTETETFFSPAMMNILAACCLLKEIQYGDCDFHSEFVSFCLLCFLTVTRNDEINFIVNVHQMQRYLSCYEMLEPRKKIRQGENISEALVHFQLTQTTSLVCVKKNKQSLT